MVFHLAAKNCIADCQADPVETSDVNVRGTVNVFEAAFRAGVRKLVYAESSALYEGSRLLPRLRARFARRAFTRLASSPAWRSLRRIVGFAKWT